MRKAQARQGTILRTVERIKAARGLTLRCKGWRQEAILRMLENNIENAEETLMIVKTQRRLINKIVKLVQEHHTYKIPEIIALPIIQGNPKYLAWITETLKHGGKKNG